MLKSIAKTVLKGMITDYIDLVSIVLMLIGFGCLVLTTVLAIYGLPQFAVAMAVIGVSLILLSYLGAKMLQALVARI